MVDYKSKYLAMKLKYINSLNKLTGGYASLDRSRANSEDRVHDEMHPHGDDMHKHEHEHRIVDPNNEGLLGPYKNKQTHWILDPHSHNHKKKQHSHNFSTQSRTVNKSTEKTGKYYHDHLHTYGDTEHSGRHLHTIKPYLTEEAHKEQTHLHSVHRDANNKKISHNSTLSSVPKEPDTVIDKITDTITDTISDLFGQSRTVQDDRSTDNCIKQLNEKDCGSNPGCDWDNNREPKCRAHWGTSEKSGKKTFQGPMQAPTPAPVPTPAQQAAAQQAAQQAAQRAQQAYAQKAAQEAAAAQARLAQQAQQAAQWAAVKQAAASTPVPTPASNSTQSRTLLDDRSTDNCIKQLNEKDCGSNPGCDWNNNREPKCRAHWGTSEESGKKIFQGPMLAPSPVPVSAPAQNSTQSRTTPRTTLTKTEINNMRVDRLKKELIKRNLSIRGTRPQLINRLKKELRL